MRVGRASSAARSSHRRPRALLVLAFCLVAGVVAAAVRFATRRGALPDTRAGGLEAVSSRVTAGSEPMGGALVPPRSGAVLADSWRPEPEAIPATATPFSIPEVEVSDATVRFINTLASERAGEPGPGATIVTTLATDAALLDEEVMPWLSYHTDLGFSRFLILWDGIDEAAAQRLEQLHHVTLARLRGAAADSGRVERLRAFTANHWQWRHRPGNYELMVKQGFAVNEAIRAARLSGRNLSDEWLFHLDVDEAFLPRIPGASTLRVQHALVGLDADVTAARFLNWEGVPAGDGVRQRLREVTTFKVHARHVDARVWRTFANALRPAGHPEWPVFLLYGNGKAAARLDTPFLRQWGPHYYRGGSHPLYPPSRRRLVAAELLELGSEDEAEAAAIDDDGDGDDDDDENDPAWREVESQLAVVLHYPYARFDELRQKAERSCPFAEAAAAGNRTQVEQCFVMGFDADVFMAAHQRRGSEQALRRIFEARVALPPRLVHEQLRTGLLREERAPSATLAQHAHMVRWGALRAPAQPRSRVAEALTGEQLAKREASLDYLMFHM